MRGGAEVARWAHNPKVIGSSPIPATKKSRCESVGFFVGLISAKADIGSSPCLIHLNPTNFSWILILEKMHFVYCLYSRIFKKTYVGRTSNFEGRLLAHNHPCNKGYTKRFQPWVTLFVEQFETIQEASMKERFYKTGKGRKIIKEQILKL